MGFNSRQGFRSQTALKPIQAPVNSQSLPLELEGWVKQSLNQEQGDGEIKRYGREMWG